jgi:alpha-glucosidase
MLALYRQALDLRRRLDLGETPRRWLDSPDGTLAFARGSAFVCVVNLGDEPWEPHPDVVAGGRLLLASDPLDGAAVPGATAAWYGRTASRGDR